MTSAEPTTADPTTRLTRPTRPTRPTWWFVVCTATFAMLVLPVLWAVTDRLDRGTGDIALIELRIRDVLSSHPPLTGAYSRYGWAHPGPLFFAVFALPYRLLGNDTDALVIVTIVFNAMVFALLMWQVSRRGLTAGVAVLGAVVALFWGTEPLTLADGWNVSVVLLPFMLCIVACWCATCGDRHSLLVAAIASAFVFQTHVGVGVVIAPIFVGTCGWVAWHRSRSPDGLTVRSVALGIVVGVVLFVPVLYDTLTDWPGNLGRLMRWTLDNDEAKVGLGDSLRMVGRTTSLSFPFSPPFPDQFLFEVGSLPLGVAPGLLLVLLVAALVISSRSAWHAETLLCGLLLVGWCSAVVAAASITRPLAWWLVEWMQPLGWLTWACVAVVAWRLVQLRFSSGSAWPSVERGVAVGAVAVVVSLVVAHGVEAVRRDHRDESLAHVVESLAVAAADSELADPMPIDFEGHALTAETMMSGVVNRVERDGRHACLRPDLAYKFRSHRVCNVDGTHLLVRHEPIALPPPDGATTLAVGDNLTPQERSEADAIHADIAEILVANDMADRLPLLDTPLVDVVLLDEPPDELVAIADDIARLKELRLRPGGRYALYLVGS